MEQVKISSRVLKDLDELRELFKHYLIAVELRNSGVPTMTEFQNYLTNISGEIRQYMDNLTNVLQLLEDSVVPNPTNKTYLEDARNFA